jgi:hypothetical protein
MKGYERRVVLGENNKGVIKFLRDISVQLTRKGSFIIGIL